MMIDLRHDGYSLEMLEDGTYMATVEAEYGCSVHIEIPEEYNGIPITEIQVYGYPSKPLRTICVSKLVRLFKNSEMLFYDDLPFFVEVSPENPWLCADDKAVFSKDKKILYAFTARGDETYTIPSGVRVIYENAFYEISYLKLVNFPEELEEIGDRAFYGCELKELTLPNNIKKIGSGAFAHGFTKLDTLVLPRHIEEMAPDSFYSKACRSPVYLPDCYNKPEFCIPNYFLSPEYIIDENSKSFTVIDGVIYSKDMKALLTITQKAPSVISVHEGVEVIACYASEVNDTIREVKLPKSTHTILNNAFSYSFLEKINLENVKIIEKQAFYSCDFLTETGKLGAEKIGDECFCACGSLDNVYLTGDKEIGKNAFHKIKKGAHVFLEEGLVTINNSFSNNCTVMIISPDTSEIKYAVKVFDAENDAGIKDTEEYINRLLNWDREYCLRKYDEFFGSLRSVTLYKYEMAYYRIKYPADLSDEMRKTYLSYLEENSGFAVQSILNKQYPQAEEIADFPYLYSVGEKDLERFIEQSVKKGLNEITAFLVPYKFSRFPHSDNKPGGKL
ncbi:MAG: leucine-rich repeat protein [Oscillospiraceae bacterium]|nr:leucine-rich repeat protein [Oscillospiraceae bacterium]